MKIAIIMLLGFALVFSACGKVNLKGLEICKLQAALGGAACASTTGVSNRTLEEMEGWTCTNAVGTKALLKQANMKSENQAVKALGLQTE